MLTLCSLSSIDARRRAIGDMTDRKQTRSAQYIVHNVTLYYVERRECYIAF